MAADGRDTGIVRHSNKLASSDGQTAFWGVAVQVPHPDPAVGFQIKTFFLLCVIVAGSYGAATVSRRILYVQAAPAALALILLWLV